MSEQDASGNLFEAEIKTLESERPRLLAGGADRKWVAILGSRLLGPFDTPEEAWSAGTSTFGGKLFLHDRVEREDRPAIVSHISWRTDG